MGADILEKDAADEHHYGYVLASGSICLIYDVEITGKYTNYTLISKNGTHLQTNTRRGGQSSNRFARLRKEKRDRWVDTCVEAACDAFLTESKSSHNIEKLIIAGPAGIKNEILGDNTFQQFFKGLPTKVAAFTEIDEKSIGTVYAATINELLTTDYPQLQHYHYFLATNPDRLRFGHDEVCTEPSIFEYILIPMGMDVTGLPKDHTYVVPAHSIPTIVGITYF